MEKSKTPKIKICGLTGLEDAEILNENEVEYGGFVLFYPKSKRNLEMNQAKKIMKNLDKKICKTAVTVDITLEQVKLIEDAGFDLLQIHGTPSKEVFEYCFLPVLKAFQSGEAVTDIYKRWNKVEGYVFDGTISGRGESFDWSLLKGFDRENKMLVLAGGLKEENVGEGIMLLNPDIVDVSSGVEKINGVGKDKEKVKRFVRAVRSWHIEGMKHIK